MKRIILATIVALGFSSQTYAAPIMNTNPNSLYPDKTQYIYYTNPNFRPSTVFSGTNGAIASAVGSFATTAVITSVVVTTIAILSEDDDNNTNTNTNTTTN